MPEDNPSLSIFMEESFAHGYAFGKTPKIAMREAGYTNCSMSLFSALMKKPNVEAIIAKDREWYMNKMAASKESLAMQLDEDRDYAYACLNPGAAVSATLGKAKMYGFMDSNPTGRTPSKITIQWGADSDEPIHQTADIVSSDLADD